MSGLPAFPARSSKVQSNGRKRRSCRPVRRYVTSCRDSDRKRSARAESRCPTGRSNTTLSPDRGAELGCEVEGRAGPRPLLDRNPLKGFRKPTEKNPRRVALTEDEYRALLKVSRRVDWRFHVALVLAHDTRHRIGAIRQLRWADIDFAGKAIFRRAEHDKSGHERATPVTADALAALDEARTRNPGTGDTPVLPPPGPDSCGLGTDARKRVAFAEAEVRQRPDGPAA